MEPSIVPKSLSELRAPGEPSKLLFLLTWPGENSDFCFLRGLLGGLIWHISVLEYLREPIVQHQNHYIREAFIYVLAEFVR